MNREQELVQELQRNEQIVQIVSLDQLNLEWGSAKGSLSTVAGYAGPAVDVVTAKKVINELGGFRTDRVILKKYAGKSYVIFKGNPADRKILRGTRYLSSHPSIIRLAIGPKGIVESARGGFLITAVLSVGIDVFDYFIRDSATLHQLLGKVSADLIRFGISAIAGAVAGLAVGSAAVLGSIPAVPLIAAVAVGVMTGVLLERVDARLGATQALIRGYRDMGIRLEEIKDEINRDVREIEKDPLLFRCFFMPCSDIRGY